MNKSVIALAALALAISACGQFNAADNTTSGTGWHVALTEMQSKALTPDQKAAFLAFVQGQESVTQFSPSAFVFDHADATNLPQSQKDLITSITNTSNGLCAFNDQATPSGDPEHLQPGQALGYTDVRYIREKGPNACPVTFNSKIDASVVVVSAVGNKDNVSATLKGNVTVHQDLTGHDPKTKATIGEASTDDLNAAVSAQVALHPGTGNVNFTLMLNGDGSVTPNDANPYSYKTEDRLWVNAALAKTGERMNVSANLELAINIDIHTDDSTPDAVIALRLAVGVTPDGKTHTQRHEVKLNGAALKPAEEQALLQSKMLESILTAHLLTMGAIPVGDNAVKLPSTLDLH